MQPMAEPPDFLIGAMITAALIGAAVAMYQFYDMGVIHHVIGFFIVSYVIGKAFRYWGESR